MMSASRRCTHDIAGLHGSSTLRSASVTDVSVRFATPSDPAASPLNSSQPSEPDPANPGRGCQGLVATQGAPG